MTRSPLDDEMCEAIFAQDVARVERLLAAGASPNPTVATGEALLPSVISYTDEAIVLTLMRAGADVPRQPNDRGYTFVHAAATRGSMVLLTELLERGVVCDSRSRHSGKTPLETAAWFNHIEIAKRLLKAGVSVHAAEDFPGPLALAELRGHDAMATLLREHGAQTVPLTRSPWPPRDWSDVAGWNAYFRYAILRRDDATEHELPTNDAVLLRNLWTPRGPKRRVLLLGNGISQLPRLMALGGDDVVALDISDVATSFARDNKIHRSRIEWFLDSFADDKTLAEERGTMTYVCGDALSADVVEGPFDLVIAQRLLHGFENESLERMLSNIASWLAPEGTLHVGLQNGVMPELPVLLERHKFTYGVRTPGHRLLVTWNFSG